MDSAENQKAEVERIKQAVNQNFRSRRAFRVSKDSVSPSRSVLAASQKRQDVLLNLWPKQPLDSLDDDLAAFGKLQLGKLESEIINLPSNQSRPGFSDSVGQMSSQNDCWKGAKTSVSVKDCEKKAYPFSVYRDAPFVENEHELSLILHYLDNIFPLQYYFYQPADSERGRAWLLSLLLRAKSSYFTALTFSCVSQILFLYQGDIPMQQKLSVDLDRYHSRGLSELQAQLDILPTISGYEHLKLGVEILACMLQMMSIEVFRETKDYDGWKDDWEVHLQAAGTLLSIIGTDLSISSSSSPSSTGGEEDGEQQPALTGTTSSLPLNEIAGLDFFMTAYMWGDVCRCASIGPNPSSGPSFPYLTYLEENRFHLDCIMGCRNWAMISIKKISNLETWKQEMQQRRTLSIPTLSRLASGLETRLRSGLEDLPKTQLTRTTYVQECNLVTELYALSALIYLAVVVSGNSHLLPELRSSVTNTLKALKALPQHLLIRVSWPYCVAGCMAAEPQKEDFRRLLLDAHTTGHMMGTLWNGLEIMEEFWKLREGVDSIYTVNKCAWVVAMDSLGAKILLI